MSFLSTGNSIFFYSEIFLLVETIIENWGKSIFKDEIYSLIFWIVETIFFLYFSKTPVSDRLFPSGGNDVSTKSFIPAGGNKV